MLEGTSCWQGCLLTLLFFLFVFVLRGLLLLLLCGPQVANEERGRKAGVCEVKSGLEPKSGKTHTGFARVSRVQRV